MTRSYPTTQMALAVSIALTFGFGAGGAAAGSDVTSGAANSDVNPANAQYLKDGRGLVAKSGYGLCWHTGSGPTPVSTAECDPNYVPPPVARLVEPAKPPVAVAAVTPKVVTQRVTLDADTLFDFDKAVLRPAGRSALDDFAGKLKGIKPETISAIGHTDRFGSGEYNQKLSERRVEAVKDYLVGKGIEASRMHTEGKGETQPVTKAGDCEGAWSAKVVACLQPDRRVEVEVAGIANAM